MDEEIKPTTDPSIEERTTKQMARADGVLAACGYLFSIAAILSICAIAYIKVQESLHPGATAKYESLIDFIQHESATLSLLLIAFVAASMGKRMLTTVRMSQTRTIPIEDLPLIRDAVIAGKSDPIDQYMRLRSLSGFSGNFAKLGVTGLPLTTVFLTLVFAVISLLPLSNTDTTKQFLDLAKLTLGAFIGSFVQGRIEQRKQQDVDAGRKSASKPDLPA